MRELGLAWLVLRLWFWFAMRRAAHPSYWQRLQEAGRSEWRMLVLFHLLWLLPIAQLACKGMYWPVGDSWRALGVFIFYLGSNLILAAVKENPWFIPQLEPPPALVITGVYAWFKHPGYIGLSLQALGQFLLFGQTWGTLPLVIYLVLLWRRARQEDLLLRGK